MDPLSTAPGAFDLDGLSRVVFRFSRYFVIEPEAPHCTPAAHG